VRELELTSWCKIRHPVETEPDRPALNKTVHFYYRRIFPFSPKDGRGGNFESCASLTSVQKMAKFGCNRSVPFGSKDAT